MEKTKVIETVMRLSRLMKRGHHHSLQRGRHHALRHIARCEGIRAKELAEQMDIRPSSCSELINDLEEEGFIIRKVSEKDARSIELYLTEKGKVEVRPNFESHPLVDKLNQALSDEEKELFVKLAEKMIAACKEDENG